MEINRTLPLRGRSVSAEALRQVADYTRAPPLRYSFTTRCCGVVRQNTELIDPGYYLNGGSTCEQIGLSCDAPYEHEIEAMADGLVPGSFVYAPLNNQIFWPGIVDFYPDGDSHFVIFHENGPHCCQPYAYYVTFVPNRAGDWFGGWFTSDVVVPLDTMVQLQIDLDHDFNNEDFDYACGRANAYYPRGLHERLERLSYVNNELLELERDASRKRSFTGEVAHQARRFSRGILRGLSPGRYQRFGGGDARNSQGTSAGTSQSQRFAKILTRAKSLEAGASTSGASSSGSRPSDSNNGTFGFSPLPTHSHENTPNVFKEPQPHRRIGSGASNIRFASIGPIEGLKQVTTTTRDIRKRSTIAAIIKSGTQRIRTYKLDR